MGQYSRGSGKTMSHMETDSYISRMAVTMSAHSEMDLLMGKEDTYLVKEAITRARSGITQQKAREYSQIKRRTTLTMGSGLVTLQTGMGKKSGKMVPITKANF